jgi:hypothetical protein
MIDPAYSPNDPTGPRKSRFWALRHSARNSVPWYVPLATVGDRAPIVVASHENEAIDLGYESRPYDRDLFLPVFAPGSGMVTTCKETADGFALELDHLGYEWTTRFDHLSKTFVATDRERGRKQRPFIRGGDVIGYTAKSPAHIRFALVRKCGDGRNVAVPAMPHLKTWLEPPSVLRREAA